MQQIVNFIVRFKNGLTFLFLFFCALYLTIEAHSYHSNKWISSTNFITGGLFNLKSDITHYIGLDLENKKLIEENIRLRNQLFDITDHLFLDVDSLITGNSGFVSIPAKLISNSYLKINNYLLLNKGEKDSIYDNMGVISSSGIVGIVEKTSPNYARVISILNSNISINAKLKKSNHFGSLIWNGQSPNTVQLIDVPRSAKISIGDSIVTGGNSLIFPSDLPIGEVLDFQLSANQGYYDIEVKLHNDMTNLKNVYVIQFQKYEEANYLIENIKEND